MSQEAAVVALSEIRENPVALRAVDKESEDYLGLVDSIRQLGLLTAISVRRRSEEVDDETINFLELCDGLHRYSAAIDAGLTEIPVVFKDLDDAQVLEAQIMANVHKIVTRPVEYTKQLMRIFAGNPTMTISDMAAKLAKTPSWVGQRLGLMKLAPGVAEAVDDGKISVSNAVTLSKLPHDEQVKLVDQAITCNSVEFVPLVRARAKELRDAKNQGREAGEIVFAPVARLQKMSVLKAELDAPIIGPQLCAQNGVTDADGAFKLGVAWALNLDPASVEVQKANAEAKAEKLAEEKQKRALDRAEKKATEAAAVAAKLQETAELQETV